MENKAVMPLSDYVDICNAVREKTGGGELLTSGQVADAIKNIPKGSEVYTGKVTTYYGTSPSGYRLPYNFIPTYCAIKNTTGGTGSYVIVGISTNGSKNGTAYVKNVSSSMALSISNNQLVIKLGEDVNGTAIEYVLVK